MCGIVGYVGGQQAGQLLLEGLGRLEHRGYDSAGVAVLGGKGLKVAKKAGRVRDLEQEQWRRSDPEKSARADGMVAQLRSAIEKVEADLEKARAAGNDRKVAELEENLASRRAFLETAERASAEYS